MKKQTGNGNGFRMGFQSSILLALLSVGLLGGAAWGQVTVISTNSGNWDAAIWSGGMPAGNDVVIAAGHTVTITGLQSRAVNSLTITGTLTHVANAGTDANIINLQIGAGGLTIDAAGKINVSEKGRNTTAGGNGRVGGTHGGQGAHGHSTTTLGTPYGSVTNPVTSGSCGRNDSGNVGSGGGVVVINVTGSATIVGEIRADGTSRTALGGGSAGGSINITANSILGGGTLSAAGGLGFDLGGGGGGGRIAVTTAGSDFGSLQMTAQGAATIYPAAAGTIYLKKSGDTYGTLLVDNKTVNAEAGSYPRTILPSGTYQFDTIITTNIGVVVVGSGASLDLTGRKLRSNSTTNSITSRLILGTAGSSVVWPSAWTNNGTISWIGSAQQTINCNLTIASGGILTHEAGSTHSVNLNLTGSLTVDPGGAIWVKNRGYPAASGPTGYSIAERNGGTHGGQGGRSGAGGKPGLGYPGVTYGSITNPVLPGGGGNYGATPDGQTGGGVVIVRATGAVTVDGTVNAEGGDGLSATGAGGSVNIVASELLGTGRLSVNGGTHAASDRGSGGGGRIAVALTNATTFGSVSMSALGGSGASADKSGVAGTIYLKGKDQAYGKLIIPSASPNNSTDSTLIGPYVTDAVVGDVELQSGARLAISNTMTLAVYGSWSNATAAGSTVGGNGAVELKGTTTNTFFGSTTFPNLICTNVARTLLFEAGKTNTVTGTAGLKFLGVDAANLLALESASPPSKWYFKVPSAAQGTLKYLAVSNSVAVTNSAAKITAVNSEDRGGNTNWIFVNPTDKYWISLSDTNWNNAANWNPSDSAPTADDLSITISNGTAAATLMDPTYTFNGRLTIQSGATLNLNGKTLTVNGAVTNAGTLTATGSETLTFSKDVDFTGGSFTCKTSTLKLNAAAAGSQTFKPGNCTFYRIEVPNAATVTFGDAGFTAAVLYCRAAGATLNFNAGSTYAVTDLLDLRGSAASDVVLTSSGTWYLNAGRIFFVRYVAVDDSNASGGKAIYAVDSEDNLGNSNWNFGNGKMWLGGSTDWGTAGNWSPSGVPGSTNYVFIDETGADPTLTGSSTITGLTVVGLSGTVALNVNMAYAGGQGLTVLDDVYIRANATLTHSANTTTYRLDMNVDGNITVDTGGSINVDSKGNSGLGSPSLRAGAGHGGEGAPEGGTGGTTYGSITNPVMQGTSGGSTAGGGVVSLRVQGALTNNGVISAKGGDIGGGSSGAGSGGSINITAGAMTSSGTISADGGQGDLENGNDGAGGGGRIAVNLTGLGQTFGNVDLTKVTAYGGANDNVTAAAGTIYLKRQGQDYGRLIVPANSPSTVATRTLINSSVTGTTVGDVELQGGGNPARLVISSGYSMTVYGSWSNAAGATAISGGTVVFAGIDAVSVWGGNTWSNLTIATLGKTVNFEAGKTQTVYGIPLFSNVTMQSTSPNSWWYLQKPGSGTQDVAVVTVQDSNAGTAGTHYTFRGAKGSVNNGNNVNWLFLQYSGSMLLMR